MLAIGYAHAKGPCRKYLQEIAINRIDFRLFCFGAPQRKIQVSVREQNLPMAGAFRSARRARLLLGLGVLASARALAAPSLARAAAPRARVRLASPYIPTTLDGAAPLQTARPLVAPLAPVVVGRAAASPAPPAPVSVRVSLLIAVLAFLCAALQSLPVLAVGYVGALACGADLLPQLDGSAAQVWLFGEAGFVGYTAYVLATSPTRTAGASTSDALRCPELSVSERARLWQRCLLDSTIDARQLATDWTRPADGRFASVRRGEFEEWVCWGVMGRVPAELSGAESAELARYVLQFEQQAGLTLPEGRSEGARPMRTTVSPLNVLTRPLLAYALTDGLVGQLLTPYALGKEGFGPLRRAGRFGYYHCPPAAAQPAGALAGHNEGFGHQS
jgi:hypothetical protein